MPATSLKAAFARVSRSYRAPVGEGHARDLLPHP